MRLTERIRLPESPDASRESNASAAWLGGLLLFVYPIGELLPFVYKNIGVGDVFLGIVYLFGILRFYRQYVQFLNTGYGIVAVAILFGMAASIVFQNQSIRALDAVAQFAVILWLLIPLVAIGISEMKKPLRYLEAGVWLYCAVVLVGTVLLLAGVPQLLLKNSGANRYFLAIQLVPFEACLVPLASAGLFSVRKQSTWRNTSYIMILLIAGCAMMLSDSRTSMVVTVAGLLLAMAVNRRPIAALMVGIILAVAYIAVKQSVWIGDLLGIEYRGVTSDSVRTDLIVSAVQSLGTDLRQLIFGSGWQGSGFVTSEASVVVHNTFVQILVEWGLVGFLCWLGIWILPWVWLIGRWRPSSAEWQVALQTITMVYIGWLFHPIATTRLHWLGFAVGMGLAYRARIHGGKKWRGYSFRQHGYYSGILSRLH